MTVIDTIRDALKKAIHAGKVIKGEEGVDSYHYHIQEYESDEIAKHTFDLQKNKLIHLNQWTQLSDIENLSFTHYNADGEQVQKVVEAGDFVRIDLPGPFPVYWVAVESYIDQPDKVEIVVKPSYDPTEKPLKKHITAHFFDKNTRNKLNFERLGNRLIAEVRGISAAVNNRGKEAGDTPVINTTVALGGWAGLQEQQWNTFTKNLVEVKTS